MRVKNLTSKNGNKIANQFIIETEFYTIFQSYESIIVKKVKDGTIFLDKKFWDYSVTTSKYRNIFLGENTKETKEKIKEGIYYLTDLN